MKSLAALCMLALAMLGCNSTPCVDCVEPIGEPVAVEKPKERPPCELWDSYDMPRGRPGYCWFRSKGSPDHEYWIGDQEQ